MATVEHPYGLMSEQHHAFAEKVAAHIAIIVNCARAKTTLPTGSRYEEEGMGVGSAVIWNGKKLILTAKHVLEEATPTSLRFFFRQGGKIDWSERPARPSLAFATSLEVDAIVRFRSQDLACLVLSDDPQDNLEFVSLPAAFADVPAAGGGVLLYGSPSDQKAPVAALRRKDELQVAFAARPRGCWAAIKGNIPPLFPSWFDPSRHFLLHYDPAEEGAMPHGFSGAGVWYQSTESGTLWSAKPVLAGIQIEWHRPSKTMIAIQSSVVEQFLTAEFGASTQSRA